MKYLYNPATDEFESLTPTLRERFSLGSKDPTPETNTDGEVAGALMDAFPNSSFLKYQNAVQEGFQGTFEEFLRDTSDKSELDMKAIEGQTAGTSLVKALLKIPDEATSVIKQKSEVKAFPAFSRLKSKSPEKYSESEKIFEKELTKNFKMIADDPLYKDVIPEKFKNIKSINELSQSEFNKIKLNLEDFQYKSITDEKGIGPYNTLSERLQNQVKGLFKARKTASERPDFFTKKIAGDTFNLPYMKKVDPGTFKNFEKVYPKLKKIESDPTVENYYKQIGKGSQGERVLINDIQAYLTGEDIRKSGNVFNSAIKINLFKGLDLENKLSKETINLLKTQKGVKAQAKFQQVKATEAAKKVNLEKINIKSIERINEIYSFDTDVTPKEVINQYYGDSYLKAKPKEKVQMLKDLRNDVVTYYKISANARPKPKGVRLPSKEKVDRILTTIMEGKGKDSFDIMGGYLRDIYSSIAESITKPGFNYASKVGVISKKFPNQHVDHTVGLTAIHKIAPGYVEAIQIIPRSVNLKKGRVLEKASTAIIDDFFTDTLNKPRKIGGETYKTFAEKVDAFNSLSKEYANANNIDTPLLRFGEPGQGPSPKETVEYFPEFSKGAQDNMMEVWNNHGLVIYTKSRPMGSSYWKTLKDKIVSNRQIKNMGGLISRVNFSQGTKIDQFTNTIEKGPDPRFGQILSAFENPDLIEMLEKENEPSLKEEVYGDDGERNLLQTFNTMFADPKAIPYYAQKLVRGAANIPEFILSTPKAGAAFIKDLKTNAGITKGGVEEILEILDPSITRDILNGEFGNLVGLSDQAIQASEEKRSGPQKTTGGILELAGELPGPATPFFLLGYAPKLLKKLRDIGVTGAAVDRVNKEIENKVAQQGVDQTRRDLILSIGAGAGVGFLKYLGLDFLSKAPKAIAKQVPEMVTTGGTPKYFFDFVNLIKSKGDDVSETASTVERQKVYDYKGYTLTEDVSSGEIKIYKDTEGGGTYSTPDGDLDTYDGIIYKEEISYTPKETVLNDKGKAVEVPDIYEESTLKPDMDGDLSDIDGGLESIDEILDILSQGGKKYSLDELAEMGINPAGIGQSNLKKILKDPTEINNLKGDDMFKDTLNKIKYRSEKAEGGIISGVKSGPPPKSGKTPHGLPYVAKNVRPIKERN